MTHTLGAIISPTDSRDWELGRFFEKAFGSLQEAKVAMNTPLPAKYDFRSVLQPVVHQGILGSCVGCAGVGAMGYQQNVYPSPDGRGIDAERLAILDGYNGARRTLTVLSPQGAHIRGFVQYAYYEGLCLESEWAYNERNEGTPAATAAESRKRNRIGYYGWLNPNDIYALKQGLYFNGPLIASLTVTTGFDEPDANAVVSNRGESRGLHAIDLVGWDDEKQCFIVRNSWGKDYGLEGHCFLPYNYPMVEAVVIRPATNMIIPRRSFMQRTFPWSH